jgi:Protein of unknown function (DUF2844)
MNKGNRMTPRADFIHVALIVLAAPAVAWAALGGSESSVQADRTQMKAALRVAGANNNYTVHEIKTPAGTMVREYLSPEGTVFAVAWKGPVIPDLRQVLGQYFEPYANGKRLKHSGHGHLTIQQPGLVVHSRGHMRAFSGQAYIPDMLPPGVTVEEIQ